MFSGILANVARERAAILRDIAYITENVRDSEIQEALLVYETCDKTGKLCTEDNIIPPEEREEIKEAIKQILPSSDSEEEIDRILSKDGGSIGIDDIMGIEHDVTDDEIAADFEKAIEESFMNEYL